jgi:hypothetical protein
MHSMTVLDGFLFGLGLQIAGFLVGLVSGWVGQVTK